MNQNTDGQNPPEGPLHGTTHQGPQSHDTNAQSGQPYGGHPQGHQPQGNFQQGHQPQGGFQQGHQPQGGFQQGGFPPGGNRGQQPPKKSSSKIPYVILGVVVLVAAVLGILWATGVFSSDDDPGNGLQTIEPGGGTSNGGGTEPGGGTDNGGGDGSGPIVADPNEFGTVVGASIERGDMLLDGDLVMYETIDRGNVVGFQVGTPEAMVDSSTPVFTLFTDYGCSHCMLEFEPTMGADMLEKTRNGEIVLDLRPLNVTSFDYARAAMFAMREVAVSAPEKFLELHEALATHGANNLSTIEDDGIDGVVEELEATGVPAATIDNIREQYDADTELDITERFAFTLIEWQPENFPGTPTVLVNGDQVEWWAGWDTILP